MCQELFVSNELYLPRTLEGKWVLCWLTHREIRAARGVEARRTVSLTKLSPAEVALLDQRAAAEGDSAMAERMLAQLEAERRLRRLLTQVAEGLPAATMVVVFPYALQAQACDKILSSLRDAWTALGVSVVREELMELGVPVTCDYQKL